MDTSKVTRVEVLGDEGACSPPTRATLELQDAGQTLKVFLVEMSPEEAASVRQEQVDGIRAWIAEQDGRRFPE